MEGPKRKTAEPSILIFADSERNADQYYRCGVMVPDPFLTFTVEGRVLGVVSALEINRVKKLSRLDEVLLLGEWSERCATATAKDGQGPSPEELIVFILKEYGIGEVRIGKDFPAGVAFALQGAGFQIEVARGMLLPGREFKTDEEARLIKAANEVSSAGFSAVEAVLEASEVVGGKLVYEGHGLTSERLQQVVAMSCLEGGAVASHVIAAGGEQACDPHESGHGELFANSLIIVDIFPRVTGTGFHGDMTRTYLKGKASSEQRALMEVVKEAHGLGIEGIRPGRNGREVYDEVQSLFERRGYRTDKTGEAPSGFFHGLGHGLGLEVHEPPRVGPVDAELKTGQVITVEPGLYYPGLGGCRIEDVVRVTGDGYEMLSAHSYRWEIA